MTTLEKEIEQHLRHVVEHAGGRCLKWICPGWSGVPDRIILLPGGRIIFAETKRPKGGTLSPLQKKWAEWLTELGFTHVVVWTRSDVESLARFIYCLLSRSSRYDE